MLMSSWHAEFDPTNRGSLCRSNLLAHLPPGNEHGPDNQRDVGTVEQQSFNPSVEWHSSHPAGQKTECLEHAPDVIGQSGRHADELSPSPRRARARWLSNDLT
jgi:hypothetical protein